VLEFKGGNDHGLPRVLLPKLGVRLYEILIFWLYYNCDNDVLRAENIVNDSRDELLRFVLFWLVFIENADRGADCALAHLKTNKFDRFPGRTLYQKVVQGDGRGSNARSLIGEESFRVAMGTDSPAELRRRSDRFGDGADIRALLGRFWWSKETILPWVQRRYLQSKFAHYNPMLGYEDEVPFDYDHICPQLNVGYWPVTDWRDRDFLRDSVGNFWILHGSLNRSLGACAVDEKLSGSRLEDGEEKDIFANASIEAFGETLPLWKEIDGSPGAWSAQRGAAFQFAVEKRAIWLYARFVQDLGFDRWIDIESEPTIPSAPFLAAAA
jgi:hypothetical protein